jgi:DNA-binding NtrC family response regulator
MGPSGRPEGPTRRILIVEDDADLGSLLVGILEDAGYAPDLVTSPEGVSGPYDLVVADYLAPRYQPGRPWPHLDRLRALGAAGPAPVIGCTGHKDAMTDDPVRLGVAAVAIKPFDVDAFLETVARVLGSEHDLSGVYSPGG